jgi:hypothetical protein
VQGHTTSDRGTSRTAVRVALVAASAFLVGSTFSENAFGAASDALTIGSSVEEQETPPAPFDCGYRPTESWLEDVRAAVSRWEIADPAERVIPPFRKGRLLEGSPAIPCLSSAHVFPFEDTDQVLLTDFSNGQLIDLLADGANDLIATHGDNYDFVGFWLNFMPHHVIGTAAYIGLENDVTGIGVHSAVGTELFDIRTGIGVNGENIEGLVVTWNINFNSWQQGTGPEAFMTRIALGHELEHRYAVYLPDLLDGRRMQGYGGYGCYGPGHWNPAFDSQGSAMGIGEWVGWHPATIAASYPDFYLLNADTGGLWSYTELYLMGYVSPVEMDAGNSELRYMEGWDCVSVDHFSRITMLTSADIIAAAGPRVPDSTAEDKNFRMGWVMIHLPGDPPDAVELAKAAAIHEQQQIDWKLGSLGRGTIDTSLFDDRNCNDVPDDEDIALGDSDDLDADGIPDECQEPPGVVFPDITVEFASPTEVRIRWMGVECPDGFTDYAIYEGQIGSWYSHTMIDCSDESADRSEDVRFGPHDTYYLVAPHNFSGEGSYGTDSADTERPPAPISCAAARNLAACP